MEVHTCSSCFKHSDKMMLSVTKGKFQCCCKICIAKDVTFMACDMCSLHTGQHVDNICEACSSLRPITVTGFTLGHCENTGLYEPWYCQLVMEFMSKSLLSALPHDLKSEML